MKMPLYKSALLRSLKHLWSDGEGSALVEGAILVPLLFALLFGTFEFSWFFYQQHLASTGIRDAARYLSRSSAPCDETSERWRKEIAQAKNLAATGSITGGAPRIKGWSATMINAHCTKIDNTIGANGLNIYRGAGAVAVITVFTRFIDPSLGFFGLLGLKPPSISVSHSERAIGPG